MGSRGASFATASFKTGRVHIDDADRSYVKEYARTPYASHFIIDKNKPVSNIATTIYNSTFNAVLSGKNVNELILPAGYKKLSLATLKNIQLKSDRQYSAARMFGKKYEDAHRETQKVINDTVISMAKSGQIGRKYEAPSALTQAAKEYVAKRDGNAKAKAKRSKK